MVRDGTIPDRWPTEIDEPVRFQIVGVKADLLPLVQRADGPDDRLGTVRQDLMVQLVVRLQRPLIRDNAISVDQRRVQQSDGIRVLLENPAQIQCKSRGFELRSSSIRWRGMRGIGRK